MKNSVAQWIASAFILACLPPVAQAKPAAPKPMPVIKKYGEVGGWTINTASMDGQHMACSAAPPGDAGKKGSFELSSEGMTVLVATAIKGAEGDESKGAYDIDGRTTRIPFYRRENNRNMGFIREAQATQLRAGKAKVMTVTIGREKTVLPLVGFDAAFKKVAECNDKGGEQTAR